MDKHLLQILLIALISAIIGLMDKVKFHWELTWFATVVKPAWLSRYLNPHYRLIEKAPKWIAFLLDSPLAAVNDFWHTLKFIMLQLIFYTFWISYHESRLIVWLIVCNAIYGVIFEVVFRGFFNRK
jgi:hypothetical protein